MKARKIVVRPASQDDCAQLHALVLVFSGENPSSSPSAESDLAKTTTASDLVMHAPDMEVFVAQIDDVVVGCCVWNSFPSLVHGGRALVFLDLLVVDRDRRRIGVATSLVRRVIEEAERLSAYKIMLVTRQDNDAALALYKSLDFEMNGVAPALYLVGD